MKKLLKILFLVMAAGGSLAAAFYFFILSPRLEYDKPCRTGSGEAAIEACTKYIAALPFHQKAVPLTLRARQYRDLKMFDKALEDITAVIKLKPGTGLAAAALYAEEGLWYEELKNYDAALAAYTKAISMGLERPGVYFSRGLVYMALKNCEAAVKDSEKGMQLEPKAPEGWVLLADAYLCAGSKEKAAMALKKAEELEPGILSGQDAAGSTAPASSGQKAEIAAVADSSELSILDTAVPLQQGPGRNGSALVQLPPGTVCRVSGRTPYIETAGKYTDYWYKAECRGQSGWVFGGMTTLRLAGRPQTVIAAFESAYTGDYFHLIFQSRDPKQAGWRCPELTGGEGDYWDFGFGQLSNELGKYREFSPYNEGEESGAEYKGRLFRIRWTVKELETPEGEGVMTPVKRQVPVILGLELLKETP